MWVSIIYDIRGSLGSSVSIVTSYGLNDWGPLRAEKILFSSPPHADRLCGRPNLLSKGYGGGVKRPRPQADHSSSSSVWLKMRGAIPTLSHTSSRCGAWLSTGVILYLLCRPTYLHLVPRSKIRGSIPPLPNTPS